MEQIFVAFLNEECSAIVQNKLPPKLGDPGSFRIPCTLANSVECLALADLGASINYMSYLLYASLSVNTLKPTRMIRLANHTYQYPIGVEDSKVPFILGRPFLHTADIIIRVKSKELNLVVGDDRITFIIDKDMQHSHSNDDTCFRMDVIDEVTKEEFDALINDSEPFLSTLEKINETFLDKEFKEFMAVDVEEILEQEEQIDDNFEELPLEEKLRIKTSIQQPPIDLEIKPLPKRLEYSFLEKDSFLLVVISALLKFNEKGRLVSFLKNHKEAFAWKTSDISGISPSFCKHKINFEDDVKPVIQRQRRLNPNMKEVVKKRLSNFSTPVSFTLSKIVLGIFDYLTIWIRRMDSAGYVVLGIESILYSAQALSRIGFAIVRLMVSKKRNIIVGGASGNRTQKSRNRIQKFKYATVSEFDIEIKNKKGAENVTADHLSRLENLNMEELKDAEIDDNFPDETLMNVSSNNEEKD
ncbi:hypothetical protein Tco_0767832 [Tanacetum coccineum]